MRYTSALFVLSSILAPFVAADLHWNGVCVDYIGGQNVYNADATQKACGNYFMRNTGSEQWDTCPDCAMTDKFGVNTCYSADKHIGGDELNYYCKLNGAGGSIAD